ncbi:MAG: HAMP domain-containing protein [Anaerolineales bacterium]|nr:HAMP domain-containing protein [Anaerolineales bacterium]
MQSDVESLSAPESFARHTALIKNILTFRFHIADVSNLTLDPEIDSFYIMSAVVEKYPNAIEHMGQARAIGSGTLIDKNVTAAERAKLESLKELIGTYSEQAKAGLERALQANPSLQAQLEEPFQATLAQEQIILELLDQQIINAKTVTLTPKEYFDATTAAIDLELGFVDTLAGQLDELLATRVGRLTGERNWTLALTLGSIILAFWLFTGFFLSVTQSLRTVVQAAEQIARTDLAAMTSVAAAMARGDLTQDLKVQTQVLTLQSQDETGELARVFNQMITGLQEAGQSFGEAMTNLSHLIGQVTDNAHNVRTASDQLAAVAEQAGQATGQIAQTMGEICQRHAATN